jgi:hypothetical protein
MAAYAAAVLFALHLFTYFVPSIRDATLSTAASAAVLLGILAIMQHLVVFPIVAALPAPRWAQGAAYIWLVIDMGTDLAQLGGAPKSVYLIARLIVNLLATLWFAVASWRQRGVMRGIGLFVAADTALYSLLAGVVSWAFVVTIPSLVLLPIWFVLAGRTLSSSHQAASMAQTSA